MMLEKRKIRPQDLDSVNPPAEGLIPIVKEGKISWETPPAAAAGGLFQVETPCSYTSATDYETMCEQTFFIDSDKLLEKGMNKVKMRVLTFAEPETETMYLRLAVYFLRTFPETPTPLEGTETSFIPTTDSTSPTLIDTGVGIIPEGAKAIALQGKTTTGTNSLRIIRGNISIFG
jgi:hypothetical protein